MSPTRFSIQGSGTDGDRDPPRTVNRDCRNAAAAVRLPDRDADHRGLHLLSRRDRASFDPRTLDRAARSAATFARTATEAGKRPVSARHRCLRPRRAVAHRLWRTYLAPD